MKAFPFYPQPDQMDCGPTCLRMISKFYGKHFSVQTLREKAKISKDGVSLLGIAEAAESIGFKTVGVKLSLSKLLKNVPLPCILHWGQNHFVVLHEIEKNSDTIPRQMLARIWGGRRKNEDLDSFLSSRSANNNAASVENASFSQTVTFRIADPAQGMLGYNLEEFCDNWLSGFNDDTMEGVALLLEPTPRLYQEEDEARQGATFLQLIEYLWQYKRLILQLGLGMLIGTLFSLILPFLTQSIVDVGIGTQNLVFIDIVLAAQVVLLLSSTSVEFLRSWILLHISTRLNLTILSDFLGKLMRLPVSFFDVKQFGDIMQRIGDQHRIESFLTGATLNIMFSIFNVGIFGLVLAFYSIPIFIVALVASGIYCIWVLLFLSQRRKLDVKRFQVSSRNQSQLVQLITGMQDIKLSGAETSKRWEWERIQAKLFRWNIKSLSLSQIQQAGAIMINQGKNILITFLSAKAVMDGQITLGGMMSIQYILGQFNAPIEQLIGFLQSWQDAQMSMERLNEIHRLDNEEPSTTTYRSDWDFGQDIVISNLTYTYPGAGNEAVLRNINLRIPHGKTTAIVGTSGSGKTTLLKLLLRFYSPEEGGISLSKGDVTNAGLAMFRTNDLQLETISHSAWRQKTGVVMQDGFIFSDTIARNIAVGEETISEQRLFNAAVTANIHDFIQSLPAGYNTKIGLEGNGISQGQKQRILIARAVYKNPDLLLFDEATNALDASNEAVILKNLENFFQGRTVVVVAHRLSTVRNADQIIVLENGEIVESGTHNDLVGLNGKYRELVSNQLELARG